MKAIARCEWVSPLKEFTTKKGDTMTKIDAKFSFADTDDSYMNEVVCTFLNKRADLISRALVAGECYELHFVVKAYRTSGGYDYNDVQPRALIKGDKDLLQQ